MKTYVRLQLGALLIELGNAITRILHKVRYLGPLRSYPARFSIFAGAQDAPWSSSGAHAWSLVRDDEAGARPVNQWLRRDRLDTAYELAVRQLIPVEVAQKEVSRILDDMLDAGAEPETVAEEIRERLEAHSTGALRELVLLDQGQTRPFRIGMSD